MTGLLALVMVGQVQSCIIQRTFAQPVYQQNYQQGYANQAYDVRTIVVPVERVEDQYIGLVGQAQRAAERQAQAQQATSSTDQKIDRLTVLVEQLQRRIDAAEPPIPSKPVASPADQLPRPALPALATPASEAVPPPPTISQAASFVPAVPARKGNGPGLTLLSTKCAGCHTGAAAKGGGHTLFAADGGFAVRDRDLLDRIDSAIASGSMPKGKQQQLTLREYVSIRDFLNEQASELALTPAGQRGKRL